MPHFSLVIPTLRRPDTFRYAFATLLAQKFDDCEIVVQNNGRDPETETIAREANDPRVRHFSSDTILTMTNNWEAALANARGDFILFIGDDDGLFPDACRTAAEVIERTDAEIVNWLPFVYYWPTHVSPPMRNRLIAEVDYDFHVQMISSDFQLRRFYRFASHYSELPMIYNSFVRRSVVERVRRSAGRYFLGSAPDVTSGIVNAARTAQFARISRPLSIFGLSHNSTGESMFTEHSSPERDKRDFGAIQIDSRLVESKGLEILLANDMLFVRDRIMPEGEIELDFRELIQSMASAINDRGDYQDRLVTIRELARRHNIDLDNIAIPTRLERKPPKCGVDFRGGQRIRFIIDTSRIRVVTIVDAISLMDQFIPRAAGVNTFGVRAVQDSDRAFVRAGETVTFNANGSGVAGLGDGWGVPERWGTWSVAKRALLRLSVDANGSALGANLTYRSFLHERHRQIQFTCRIRGHDIATWDCTTDAGSQPLIIPVHLISAGGNLDLEFVISEPHSPVEYGINEDSRLLGLGIETLTVWSDSGRS